MTKDEYEEILRPKPDVQILKVIDLSSGNRTLLYGYTTNRLTWHVYLKDDKIFLHVYKLDTTIFRTAGKSETKISDIVPDKRLYPDACDFETCSIIRSHDLHVPFTTYGVIGEDTKRRYEETGFYGLT